MKWVVTTGGRSHAGSSHGSGGRDPRPSPYATAGRRVAATRQLSARPTICCPAFDFDVIRWGWGAGSDPSSLLYITTTDEIPTGTSETGYSNPEYDKLFDEQEITVDAAKRKELLWKLQEILLRDVPYIIAYYADNVMAYRTDRFQGYVVDPEGLLDLSGRISLTAISPVQ